MSNRTLMRKCNLFLENEHLCCDEAEWYLFPPNKAICGIPDLHNIGFISISSIGFWNIDLGDGGPLLSVRYCPWCGIKLVQRRE